MTTTIDGGRPDGTDDGRADESRATGAVLPIRPWIPEGRIVPLPGRGEAFARTHGLGSGRPTVLLLHGWLATADLNWFNLYRTLGERYAFVAPDHRGHGRGIRSPQPFTIEDAADDADALLEALGVERAIVVGYSMGGPIAMRLTERHPDRVDALVLTATALEWRAHLFDRLRWRFLAALSAALRAGAGEWAFRSLVDETARTDELVAAWRTHLIGEVKRGHVTDAIAAGHALAEWDFREGARALHVPTAAVITGSDRLVDVRRQRQLALEIGAHEIVLDDADHDAAFRLPGRYADAVMEAIDTVADAHAQRAARPRRPLRPRRRWRLRRGRQRARRRNG